MEEVVRSIDQLIQGILVHKTNTAPISNTAKLSFSRVYIFKSKTSRTKLHRIFK